MAIISRDPTSSSSLPASVARSSSDLETSRCESGTPVMSTPSTASVSAHTAYDTAVGSEREFGRRREKQAPDVAGQDPCHTCHARAHAHRCRPYLCREDLGGVSVGDGPEGGSAEVE
eukprot:CAMPEP_0196749678 /NCGR_PEP_ID=MMETSP1091-20130531/77845_1 /TAXON_ID=302021 /ORGANISM="Rhodomonas sp., Strain CCMP768" /LENGTH=116 /DNA_ID=CAMNT_0042097187 /DNA_START=161 /DNA_END=510 /DNA_ORIENTATION=-